MRKRIYIDCLSNAPVLCKSDGTEGDGADNTVGLFTAGQHQMEVRYEQTNGDILPVRTLDANSCSGWLIPLDAADNDGIEMGFGILGEDAEHVFTVGTDAAFQLEVKLGIPVVADFDVCAIGFRTIGAYADAINSASALYAAYSGATNHAFGINIDNGDYKVFKTTNGTDAQDDVSVTDAVNDDAPVLNVSVSLAGAVSASVDGVAITLTNAGTAFDVGDIIVPYFVFAKDANGTDTHPIFNYIKCGYK